MTEKTYLGMLVEESHEGNMIRQIKELSIDNLPEGDVLVRVEYSSLNYKDALSASGNRGVTRKYPHTPGIDAAGVVEKSTDSAFKAGDRVIVTSYDLGMNTSGGFGQYIRVPSEWVVRLPENLSLKESMMYGTAGFTAALSVYRLIDYGIKPDMGGILVSGATGGVGSIALSILSKTGYSVTAVNGIEDETAYLKEIGADSVISIEETLDRSNKPLLKTRWAGCVDTTGGEILATSVKSTAPGGAVTSCGNVASNELPLTVFPFILRGVSLIGIDSQNCPMNMRQKAWDMIANEWKIPWLDRITKDVSLKDADQEIEIMLKGRHRGRTVISLWD